MFSAISVAVVQNYLYVAYVENLWKCHKPVHPGWELLVFLNEKLRVIHLFEADYNLVIGLIFGRRALYSGVENRMLHSS